MAASKLITMSAVTAARGFALLSAEQLGSDDVQLKGGVLGTTGIRCPYHQWTYALDGHIASCPALRGRCWLFQI